ncbi:hypothetical protein [Sphingomonas morindae]|uniref:Lipoprotein n=1 Tax=Sphingomonas morindae TaxID=1541170 RepID=A0ABY4XDF3_9SPHN|nr:hypothetical protein [Sphingomonas morindae]USI75002.1 hypothetical protein LHA26_17710 [Sphingomonas morindae]
MMPKTTLLVPLVVAQFAAMAPLAAQPILEDCHGTETVKIGNGAPRTIPYALSFKADLAAGTYCYGSCTKAQTYPIADAASSPLKLSDMASGGQARHLLFDRVTGRLTDDQQFDAGLGTVTRRAVAICKPPAR